MLSQLEEYLLFALAVVGAILALWHLVVDVNRRFFAVEGLRNDARYETVRDDLGWQSSRKEAFFGGAEPPVFYPIGDYATNYDNQVSNAQDNSYDENAPDTGIPVTPPSQVSSLVAQATSGGGVSKREGMAGGKYTDKALGSRPNENALSPY